MSSYMSIDCRREVKQRISMIDQIKENLVDMKAELEELEKMNPMIKTQGSGDRKRESNGNSDTDRIIAMGLRRDGVRKRVAELEAIKNDFERGWRLLLPEERTIMEMRFKQCISQKEVGKVLSYDKSTINRKESEALRKMSNEMMLL